MLLYRRGRRAEALTIGGICLCYVGYNSGYYLPFGGGFMGPRFLTTMLPFLAMPLGIAFKRYPGPTIALGAVSITTTVIATITHPLIGYETETVVWVRYLREGLLPADDRIRVRARARLGRDLAVPARRRRGVVLARVRDAALRLSTARCSAAACWRCVAWALFAALAPTVLGIDHQGLLSIVRAGDNTALSTKLHPTFSSYPLKALAPIAAAAGLLALAAMRLVRNQPRAAVRAPQRGRGIARAAGTQQLISCWRASRSSSRSREAPCRRRHSLREAGCGSWSGPRRSACWQVPPVQS